MRMHQLQDPPSHTYVYIYIPRWARVNAVFSRSFNECFPKYNTSYQHIYRFSPRYARGARTDPTRCDG